MDLYIYSDESGVFDNAHNEIFVYTAKKAVRCGRYSQTVELKACRISNKEKGKLYRSLNQVIRFGIVVNQKNVLDRIFLSKKDKQRYLDYAYKVGLKRPYRD